VEKLVRILFYLYFGIAGADIIRSLDIRMAEKAKHAQAFDQISYSKFTKSMTGESPK
jgi:hypothetical protein